MSPPNCPNNVIKMPGVSTMPDTKTYKDVKSTMETVLVTREGIDSWKLPPFQRPLRENAKLYEVRDGIKASGGIIPGVITIGVLNRTEKYVIDGQHRIEGFKMTELDEGIADVRMCHFDSMAEMGDEFVKLNSRIAPLRPDDILRGLEGSVPALKEIRARCPYIGYDMIRRGAKAPIVSMSLALRSWLGSALDIPTRNKAVTRELLSRLDTDETNRMVHFFSIVWDAWRNDPEYVRMWSALNLTVAAWLWRHCVISQSSPRITRLTPQQFGRGMLALTANKSYLDWLVRRSMGDRDRSPCYSRMKAIIVARVQEEFGGKKAILPSPPWAPS